VATSGLGGHGDRQGDDSQRPTGARGGRRARRAVATCDKGLRVHSKLDKRKCPLGVTVSKAETKRLEPRSARAQSFLLDHRTEKPVQLWVISTVLVPGLAVTLEIPFWLSSTIQSMSPGFML
jgi:hypothetical protein